jgi:acyl-coenzyme A thioesterase PaaI-like protein
MSTFSSATAVTAVGDGNYSGHVSPDWTIGGKPNGGYLLAMVGRAAAAEVPHEHVLAISAHYLTSPDPGPAVLATEVLRTGRSASQVRVRLSQEDKACVEALVTIGTLDPDAKPYWDGGVPDLAPIDHSKSIRVEGPSPLGVPLAMMQQIDLRLDPSSIGFAVGQPSGHGELHGWLDLLDDQDFDPYSLVFAVDSFPPATFDVEVTGWVPTLELTVYVRALPAPGPVRVLQKAVLVDAGRVDEVCYVWDSTGRLVAQGTQLAAIRLG